MAKQVDGYRQISLDPALYQERSKIAEGEWFLGNLRRGLESLARGIQPLGQVEIEKALDAGLFLSHALKSTSVLSSEQLENLAFLKRCYGISPEIGALMLAELSLEERRILATKWFHDVH